MSLEDIYIQPVAHAKLHAFGCLPEFRAEQCHHRNEDMEMRLKPSEIRFSQDSILSKFFKRCPHRNKTIGETLDDLLTGKCSIEDIPTIKVQSRDGKWYTADNRRLWVFKKLEERKKCGTIPVCTGSINSKKLTSNNHGTSVTVRGNAGGQFWRNWREQDQKIVEDVNPERKHEVEDPLLTARKLTIDSPVQVDQDTNVSVQEPQTTDTNSLKPISVPHKGKTSDINSPNSRSASLQNSQPTDTYLSKPIPVPLQRQTKVIKSECVREQQLMDKNLSKPISVSEQERQTTDTNSSRLIILPLRVKSSDTNSPERSTVHGEGQITDRNLANLMPSYVLEQYTTAINSPKFKSVVEQEEQLLFRPKLKSVPPRGQTKGLNPPDPISAPIQEPQKLVTNSPKSNSVFVRKQSTVAVNSFKAFSESVQKRLRMDTYTTPKSGSESVWEPKTSIIIPHKPISKPLEGQANNIYLSKPKSVPVQGPQTTYTYPRKSMSKSLQGQTNVIHSTDSRSVYVQERQMVDIYSSKLISVPKKGKTTDINSPNPRPVSLQNSQPTDTYLTKPISVPLQRQTKVIKSECVREQQLMDKNLSKPISVSEQERQTTDTNSSRLIILPLRVKSSDTNSPERSTVHGKGQITDRNLANLMPSYIPEQYTTAINSPKFKSVVEHEEQLLFRSKLKSVPPRGQTKGLNPPDPISAPIQEPQKLVTNSPKSNSVFVRKRSTVAVNSFKAFSESVQKRPRMDTYTTPKSGSESVWEPKTSIIIPHKPISKPLEGQANNIYLSKPKSVPVQGPQTTYTYPRKSMSKSLQGQTNVIHSTYSRSVYVQERQMMDIYSSKLISVPKKGKTTDINSPNPRSVSLQNSQPTDTYLTKPISVPLQRQTKVIKSECVREQQCTSCLSYTKVIFGTVNII